VIDAMQFDVDAATRLEDGRDNDESEAAGVVKDRSEFSERRNLLKIKELLGSRCACWRLEMRGKLRFTAKCDSASAARDEAGHS
jgi:hypothetical protein